MCLRVRVLGETSRASGGAAHTPCRGAQYTAKGGWGGTRLPTPCGRCSPPGCTASTCAACRPCWASTAPFCRAGLRAHHLRGEARKAAFIGGHRRTPRAMAYVRHGAGSRNRTLTSKRAHTHFVFLVPAHRPAHTTGADTRNRKHAHGALACQRSRAAPRRTTLHLNRLAANRFADKTLFTPSVLGYPLFTWQFGVV